MKTAVVGLGSMGFGMARMLVQAGHDVWGVDVNSDAEARFRAAGGQSGGLPDDVASVVVVVLNAAQTEAALFGGNGVADGLREGTVVLGCATVPPDFARAMEAACAERGLLYLDAPISGGSLKAADGTLSVLASGSAEAFRVAKPVLDAVSAQVFELGDTAGPGSAMKAVNQLLAGVNLATMAEALTFGMTQGVSPAQFAEVIPQCAGTSWMLENRVSHIVEGDYTPRSQVAIWPKDLGIVLEAARDAGFSAPITAAALQQYMVAMGRGLGPTDDAALAKVYAANVGLDLPGDV